MAGASARKPWEEARASSLESAEAWSLSAEPMAEIGAGASPNVALYHVRDVTPLERGRVAVGTLTPPRALIFEPDGTSTATLGREGDGPGERPSRASGRAIVLLIGLLSAFCATEDPSEASETPGDTVTLDPAVVIGALEGDPSYLFGAITAVASDDEGRIYVADRIGATVRAYSPDGEFLALLAQAGEGPGEISGWAPDLAFGPDGRLYVPDGTRVTVFARSGPAGLPDSVADTWRLSGYGNLTPRRGRIDREGTYHYPHGLYRLGERPRFFYLLFEGGEPTGDTLEVPPYPGLTARRSAFYRTSARGGRMVRGLARVPFAPAPSWDVTDAGTLLSTDGRDPVLFETALSGDTIRTLRVGDAARPVPPDEREDSLRALEARIDSLSVPLEDVVGLGENVAERRLPERLPAVIGLYVSRDGSVWVERWPPAGAGDTRLYDVFAGNGTHRGTVALRAPLAADPPPYVGRDAIVGVVRDADTGVERVVRFALDGALPNFR